MAVLMAAENPSVIKLSFIDITSSSIKFGNNTLSPKSIPPFIARPKFVCKKLFCSFSNFSCSILLLKYKLFFHYYLIILP